MWHIYTLGVVNGVLSKSIKKTDIWTNDKHFPTQVHMVTYVRVGLHRGVTPRSW